MVGYGGGGGLEGPGRDRMENEERERRGMRTFKDRMRTLGGDTGVHGELVKGQEGKRHVL